jgi:integrase
MTKNLTNTFVSSINTAGRYFDNGTGVHLWVKPNRNKYWIFRYTFDKKRKDMSLGVYPITSLIEARKQALEAKINIRQGTDPLTLKKALKTASNQKLKSKISFKEFANECIEKKRYEWKNPKHHDQWVNTLTTYAYPVIGEMPLNEINTEDILKILSPIWQTKTETASRLRGRIELILSSARARGLRADANPAQWRGHLDTILSKPKRLSKIKHHSALSFNEIPKFIKTIHEKDCITALALEFLILTAARTGEVIGARKNEISQDVWTIPGNRMKNGKEHRVPLSERAIQLVGQASRTSQFSEFIFSNNEKPISNMAMLAMVKRINPRITVHGFRSSFRDWVSEMTDYSHEVAEKALAHTISNQVEAAYRRGDLLAKRRILMNSWNDYCLGKNNVIYLSEVA